MIGGQAIRVITKPGFSGWDTVSPTLDLLAEAIDPTALQVALFGCGHGALAVALARRTPLIKLTLCDPSMIALAMAARTLQASGLYGMTISTALSLLPDGAEKFDSVLIDLPQSRQLARRWLVEAHELLREGGTLLLAGPNELGVQSVIEDVAALFGSVALVTYRRKCRIVRATRAATQPTRPNWAQEPGIQPGSWHELELQLAGMPSRLASLPGVFGYEGLDAGTALLLSCIPDPHGLRVLDIGCGYGAIGIFVGLCGAAHVDLVDSNRLAVAAAHENLTRYTIPGEALASDVLDAVAGQRYDLILSNPPFHVGKTVSLDAAEIFVRQGQKLLTRGGRMVLVANRFIRHDRLLSAAFGNCETLADNGHYWVLMGKN